MRSAMVMAERARAKGEVPVGAVIVVGGEQLAVGHNQPISAGDPSAHAEIVAIRAACVRRENYRLPGTTLYVTLEPCAMCAGAIVQARIERVVFGAHDPKAGAAGSVFDILPGHLLNHRVRLDGGVLAESAGLLLSDFFREKRKINRTERG